jgi:hypothetical protein
LHRHFDHSPFIYCSGHAVNRRKERGRLEPQQCKALNYAWWQAAKDGYPLNALISIRPAGDPTPLEHAEIVDRTWNRAGVWSRRHTPSKTFHAVLVRETVPSEHFHILMHVASANLTLLRYALTRWFPEPGEVDITRANQTIAYTPLGKIKSALGYITKERTPQAAWLKWQYRPGRPVLGKRYRISANLRAKPVEFAVPRGISSKTKSPKAQYQAGRVG